jgi:hypothetical protein
MSWRQIGEDWIRVPQSGIRRSAPWRLGKSGGSGALTQKQQADLASHFELDPTAIAELSRSLSVWLDSTKIPDWVTVRQSVAEKGGEATLRRALQEATRARQQLEKQLRELDSLRVDFRASAEASAPFHQARASLAAGLVQLQEAQDGLERALQNPGTVRLNTSTNRRQDRDERRIAVLTLIFKTWRQAGRRLTYTTDPVRSERGGPMIEFANRVVGYVTEPPSELPGDMIVRDLKAFLKAKPDSTHPRSPQPVAPKGS